MNTVLILGSNGMLGHVVERVLSKNPDVVISTLPDFRYPRDSVDFKNQFDYIINCIGTVKPAIKEDSNESVLNAIYTNSILPRELAKLNPKAMIIHATTDCVYSGDKRFYNETDSHDPTDVYGKTKSLGEIKEDTQNVMNLRVSIIGFEKNTKRSLVEWFYNLPQKYEASGWTRAKWNGITCLAWAKIVNGIINSDTYYGSTFHIVPEDVVNKHELLNCFRRVFNRPDISIKPIPGENIDRTLSTDHNYMNEQIWAYAGYEVIPTIEELIQEMYDWYKVEFPERFK